jgi:general L-amino acid transport system permease protein
VAGIVLATGLGFAVAVGRVSGNILASAIAVVYVEVLRNTPLLVQLIFWFRAVVLPLPAIAQSGEVFGADVGGRRQAVFFWSQRGTALAWPRPGAPGWAFVLAVAGMCVAAWLVWRWRRRVEERSGVAARSVLWSGATAALVLGIGWWLWPAQPLVLEWPAVGRFRYEGGLQLTPEFTALLLGLVTYTAAYIAEVFRSGLNAVSRGQREAAQALGLRDPQVLRFVVLPQALRVVIPPLTSQYLNLIKNSSLAIYIGYPDLFNVSLTIGNQTGQFVVLTGMVMVVYLAWSLLTSLIMNVIFRRVQVVER